MIHYIVQTIVFQLLFLALYEVFLKQETFFQHNRVYLLSTSVLSIVIPFVKIPILQTTSPEMFTVFLPEVVLRSTAAQPTQVAYLSGISLLQRLYIAGIVLSALLFLWKLRRVLSLKSTQTKEQWSRTKIITLANSKEAFSFLNTIYIGEALTAEEQKTILHHEAVHIKQKHYLDLLWFELLRIVFWFNPLVYFYQKRITETHEYIADSIVAVPNKKDYYLQLLAQTFETTKISFTNTFFNHSFIKKRIVMLQKTKSKKNFQWKYALIVPLLFGMLLYTSCSEESSLEKTETTEEQLENIDFEKLLEDNDNVEFTVKNKNGSTSIIKIEKVGDNEQINTNGLTVPFATIEKVPLYPGCEGNTNEELKACLSKKITAIVSENFDTSLAKKLNLEGRQRISVQFAIDNTGTVTNIKARGPHPELETEAIRIMELLPQMIAGEQGGKKVTVLYSLPILFQAD